MRPPANAAALSPTLLRVAEGLLMDPVLAWVAPSCCPACSAPLKHPTQGPLCEACWGTIPRDEGRTCRCGAPLRSQPSSCGRCHRGLTPFVRGASLGPLEGALRCLIQDIEERGRRRVVERLADLLLSRQGVQELLQGPPALVPVPLHPLRLEEKGFNPSELLASALGHRAGLVVSADALVRRKEPPKSRCSPGAWRRSLEGAFATKRRTRIAGRVVVVVDTVYGSGATARACAQALEQGGAAEVRLLTAARVVALPEGAAGRSKGETRLGGRA